MELTCYVYDEARMRMRPAGPKREWMDQSVDGFAYRCLPLAIANAHGWEILSPCGFEARWNGGLAKEAVELRYDPGTAMLTAPVSLFGQATITFDTGGLFRTPPGWNLWVTGPPNEAKDGIAPLSGVVETDWSPYSFTMNWRFTRPGHWVRFEENEPIAFVFPVQRDAIESFAPKIRSIREAPEVEAQYLKWSKDRIALAERMKEAKPASPADQWQKSYYRGLDAFENPGPDDHQTKLRLKPFVGIEGGIVDMPEARRCPAFSAPVQPAPPAPPPPSQPPPAQSGGSRFSLGAPVLGGFAPPRKPGG